MTIYVTKYATTKGILTFDDAVDCGGGMVKVRPEGYDWYFHKGDWFITAEAAAADAMIRITKKIASLKKQVAKLEKQLA